MSGVTIGLFLYYWFKFCVIWIPIGVFELMLIQITAIWIVAMVKYAIPYWWNPPFRAEDFEWHYGYDVVTHSEMERRKYAEFKTYLPLMMLMGGIMYTSNGDSVRIQWQDANHPKVTLITGHSHDWDSELNSLRPSGEQ